MTLQEKNQKLRKSVLPTLIIWWPKLIMKLWQLTWLLKDFPILCICVRYSKVATLEKMAFTCSPIPTIKLSSPLDKYVNVYYNYYTQFCQTDLIKKWNHETFLFMTSKKGKYVLEFEIGIGLGYYGLYFFIRKSSCMRNTYYAKIHGQFFFPLLKVFPFNSSEWHCNHLLERVLTLLRPVLPTLKSL